MSKKPEKVEEKIAFVISPIGEEKSTTRKRSDQILKYVIEPIVSQLGFKTIRADKIPKPGMITTQIIQHILNDPLVIADLTDHNPNVMYELALRHAIKKPTVQLISENQNLPFDISANRTIKLDHRDLDSVDFAKGELKKQITEVLKDPSLVDSPISQAIALSGLEQSDNPIGKMLANMSSTMGEILSRLGKIEGEINDDNMSTNSWIYNPSSLSIIKPNELTTMDEDELNKFVESLSFNKKKSDKK